MPLDCVIVGHNEGNFESRVRDAQAQQERCGVYDDIQMNSVIFGGRRIKYMELLRRAIAEGAGLDLPLSVFKTPHLGGCYLTSFLCSRGIDTALVNSYRDDLDKLRTLLHERPRAVAITTTFYVEDDPIREVVELVRAESPTSVIVVGGPRIYSICADYDAVTQDFIFEDSIGADIYIGDSQGETTLWRLLVALRDDKAAIGKVPNLIVRTGTGQWTRTGREVENNNLDDNAVQWSLFETGFVSPTVALRTARSCPYSCSFCNYPTMAGAHVLTSLDVLQRELRYLHDAGVKWINFIDDTFNVPLPRFKQLLRMMIDNKFGFEWTSFLRCGNADSETFDLMKASGCAAVLLGIESGDDRMLTNMNKKVTVDRYRYGIGRLNEVGIASYASFIVGFPGETDDSVRQTLDFIEESAPTFFSPQLYYHDQQSPIHRRAADFGLTGGGYAWTHDNMTWQRAAEWARVLFRDVRAATPLTLDGLSMWAFTHLFQNGIDLSLIKSFGEAARPMLADSFQDRAVDPVGVDYQRLLNVFREPAVRRRLAEHSGASRAVSAATA